MVSDIKHYSPLGRSDHSVLVFDYNCYIVMDSNSRMKFSYDKGNLPAMNSDLSLDWTNYFKDCSENVSLQWSLFKTKLLQVQDQHVPHRLTKGRPQWMNKGKYPIDEKTRKEIRSKHRAWEKAYTTKSESSKLIYNRQRNKVSGVKLGSACRLPLADSEFQDPIQIVRIRFEKWAYTNYYKLRKLIRGTNL